MSRLDLFANEKEFTPSTLTLDSGVTRPPPLLSEADLLDRMDKAGIGTDATMHDHIKKLTDRFYATKDASGFSPTNLGEALVMGYDDMGYELWKPHLRAMMECDMKAVSLGTKRKADVLVACLQQMKSCFLDARSNKVKLFQAMEIFFERSNAPDGVEQHNIGDVVRRCGVCQDSDMVLKKKPDGKFMVGCLAFPQCRNVVWLPGSVSEAAVTTTVCNTCTPGPIFMIQFTFRRLEIPPNYNANHLGCIGGCDDVLRELVEICGSGPRNVSSVPARGRGSTTSSRNDPRSNPRQSACVHCQQTGHSSSDCPSQTSHFRSARSLGMNTHSGDSSISCNTCGAPCVLRTANTENNRGRKFYSCQTQGCNFFVCWEDDPNPRSHVASNSTRGSATSSGRRGGRGRGGRGRGDRGGSNADGGGGRFVSATGEPVSSRSCFVCGDPSHFANACPSRGVRN